MPWRGILLRLLKERDRWLKKEGNLFLRFVEIMNGVKGTRSELSVPPVP